MGRPREHDPEVLLDHARALWVEKGTTGLTIRALSSASGVSNGAIYHAFGSRNTLLAHVWVREADKFLTFQRDRVAHVLGESTAQDGVVEAALAPADYARFHPEAAHLLVGIQADDLMHADLAAAQQSELIRLRSEVGDLVVNLADRLWQRRDRDATALIKICVVDLPGTLLFSRDRLTSPLARHALTNAVRGITGSTPPVTS